MTSVIKKFGAAILQLAFWSNWLALWRVLSWCEI